MAGTVTQIVVPVSIHHRWDMLLPSGTPAAVSQLDTFGCELTLLDTHHALCDPIQDVLWGNTHFHLVVQDCFQIFCTGRGAMCAEDAQVTLG